MEKAITAGLDSISLDSPYYCRQGKENKNYRGLQGEITLRNLWQILDEAGSLPRKTKKKRGRPCIATFLPKRIKLADLLPHVFNHNRLLSILYSRTQFNIIAGNIF